MILPVIMEVREMKEVAECLGKEVLAEVESEVFYCNISNIRNKLGDRAVLRAIHFIEENKRVARAVEALKAENIESFIIPCGILWGIFHIRQEHIILIIQCFVHRCGICWIK